MSIIPEIRIVPSDVGAPCQTVLPAALCIDQSLQPSSGPLTVPAGLTGEVEAFVKNALNLCPIRDSLVWNLVDEYESDPARMQAKYRPENIREDMWETSRDFLLHMNTTKIAMRSLSGVYAGSQTRSVTGTGPFVEELNELVQSPMWSEVMEANYGAACLTGTSAVTPYYDVESDQLDLTLHDAVRLHLYANDSNVRDLQALIEFDRSGRWMRYVTRSSTGIIRANGKSQVSLYPEPLRMHPSVISYGESRLAFNDIYGKSLVWETPGYNRILTHIFWYLALLIKWQSKSLLVVSGIADGAEPDLKSIRQVNGNTAWFLKNGKAEFLSPSAKFAEILSVANAYLSFLAVSLNIPKSVFVPSDNQSGTAARLEGAPQTTTLRSGARRSETVETNAVLKAAFVLHLQRGQNLSMRELRAMYQPSIGISTYDYIDSNPDALAGIKSDIAKLIEAVGIANPEMTPSQVEDHVATVSTDMLNEMAA